MDEKLKNFYELYDRRKSTRDFDGRPIEPEIIARLLATLQRAQSAANRQPWHFILSENTNRDALNSCLTKEGFKTAPLLIVVCADQKQAWTRKADGVNYAWVDAAIAVTEMIGAATAEGLGACWIAAVDPQTVRESLNIPGHIDVVAIIALGYPKANLVREEKTRKPLTEFIHNGKW